MREKAMSLYKGLRDTVEKQCTIIGMKDPEFIPDDDATKKGYTISRPVVDHVKVVIRVHGMWMLIDIHVVREVIRSVMAVIKQWCTTMLGESELSEVPNFEAVLA